MDLGGNDEEGYTKLQIHHLLALFGSKTILGGLPHFEGNNILIESKF